MQERATAGAIRWQALRRLVLQRRVLPATGQAAEQAAVITSQRAFSLSNNRCWVLMACCLAYCTAPPPSLLRGVRYACSWAGALSPGSTMPRGGPRARLHRHLVGSSCKIWAPPREKGRGYCVGDAHANQAAVAADPAADSLGRVVLGVSARWQICTDAALGGQGLGSSA